MSDQVAILQLPGQNAVELPILKGTAGNDVIDIRKLGKTGYFTYDPGFLATASCESSITFIDGDKGILEHRGFPISQLAEKSDYLEVCYLLLNGTLPDKQEFDWLSKRVVSDFQSPKQFIGGNLNHSLPPFSIRLLSVLALRTWAPVIWMPTSSHV